MALLRNNAQAVVCSRFFQGRDAVKLLQFFQQKERVAAPDKASFGREHGAASIAGQVQRLALKSHLVEARLGFCIVRIAIRVGKWHEQNAETLR